MCLHFMQRCNSAPNLFVLFVSYKIKTNSTSTISKYYNLPQTSMLLIEIWVLLILFLSWLEYYYQRSWCYCVKCVIKESKQFNNSQFELRQFCLRLSWKAQCSYSSSFIYCNLKLCLLLFELCSVRTHLDRLCVHKSGHLLCTGVYLLLYYIDKLL